MKPTHNSSPHDGKDSEKVIDEAVRDLNQIAEDLNESEDTMAADKIGETAVTLSVLSTDLKQAGEDLKRNSRTSVSGEPETKKPKKNKKKKKSKKRRKKKRRIWPLVLIIVLAVLIGGGFYAKYYYEQCQAPVSDKSEEVMFEVGTDDNLSTVSRNLADQGLIRNRIAGYIFATHNHLTDLYAGKFALNKNMSMAEIYTTLNNAGATYSESDTVTIVEGDWAKDIASKIAAVSSVSADELMALWNNADWIRSEMSKYPFLTEEMFNENVRCYLEGYLCPDTYQIDPDSTAEEITEVILNQTLAVYQKYEAQFKASSLSTHQIYTLASIVQYEGGSDEEVLKNIASVFYNRLEAGMPLQSSVTVCYAIDFDKNADDWQSCEVNTDFDSPYNTYLNTGLPPGPIQNPGTAALEAVLNPNKTDYYFFVADVYGDGTVYFSRTEEEHDALVAKYLGG